MKMRPEIFEREYADMRAILEEIVKTGLQPWPHTNIDPADLTMRDMWDLNLRAHMDRGNAEHPVHSAEGCLPRVLEFTDQSPHVLYNEEDLDDSHIETAFRRMLDRWAEDRQTVSLPSP